MTFGRGVGEMGTEQAFGWVGTGTTHGRGARGTAQGRGVVGTGTTHGRAFVSLEWSATVAAAGDDPTEGSAWALAAAATVAMEMLAAATTVRSDVMGFIGMTSSARGFTEDIGREAGKESRAYVIFTKARRGS